MIFRQPDYNKMFKCIGGTCPDTCCRDWSIVPDEDALKDYETAPEPLRFLLPAYRRRPVPHPAGLGGGAPVRPLRRLSPVHRGVRLSHRDGAGHLLSRGGTAAHGANILCVDGMSGREIRSAL